jgi:hypothetical protein
LAVIGGCPLELQFALLAVRHQQTPFGLGAQVHEGVFFLEGVEEIFQLVVVLFFDELHRLV